jgi:hypothetical protein
MIAVRLGHENDLVRAVLLRIIRQQAAHEMQILPGEILMHEQEVHSLRA